MSEQQQKVETQLQQNVQTQIKQQSQPAKKQHSYTYWVDEKNKSRELPPQQRPKKIQAPTQLNNIKSEDGRSHWNTAGTWEPRPIKISEIEKAYHEKVTEWMQSNASQLSVKNISLNGDCEIVFTRNKKVLTYELNGKVEFQKNNVTQKQEEKSETEPENTNKSQTESENSSQSGSQSDLEKKPSKSKIPKPKKLTFELVDLTDQGDREFKIKTDDTADKKFLSEKADTLLSMLEEIIKSYK